ncbi:MAG TPA: carboxypeptidase-like regulatory domain-containing protein, partial [Chloroflexota bacterium]
MSLSIAALRRGQHPLIALLVVLLTIGNAGLGGPTDRASAASVVTVSAVNALNGAPLANVSVAATPVSGGVSFVATTGGEGRAQISLSAGQYFFGPSESPGASWVRRPLRPPVTATVDGTNAPPQLTIELVPVAATGTVRDASGVAVQGANVLLLGPDKLPLGDAQTGPDGSFRIGGATTSNSYFVVANPPEANTTLAPSEAKTISVTVSNAQIASPADAGLITLPTATKFAHIGIDAPGMAVGPIVVNALRDGQASQPGVSKRVQYPASPGGFDLPLRPGAWNISIAPAGDNTSATWASPLPKSVAFTQADGAVERVDVRFALGSAQLSGRVVDVQGRPVDGVFVQLSNKDHTVNMPGAPGTGGTFKIGGIASPGTYYLRIQPSPSSTAGLLPPEPQEINVEQDPSGTLLFTVSGDAANARRPAPIALGDIVLRAATKTITGTITRSDGKELGATIVNAFPAQGGGPGSAFFNTRATVSGAQGTFTLNVAPGTWQVNINPDFQSNGSADWIYAGQPVTVSFASDSTSETKSASFLVSSADYTITAQVLLPDGRKPADNSVFINVHNRAGFGRGEPVRDGVFSMRVPAGTYEVDVFGGNGEYGPPAGGIATFSVPDPTSPDSKTVKLGTNGVLTLSQRTGSISGKVVDQTGQGLAGINVNAWNPTTNDRGFGQTGPDGGFNLRVGDGSYDVDAFPGPDAPYARQGTPQRVTVTNGSADKSPTFTMLSASATVTVRAVDASGNLITDANGFAFAMKSGSTGPKVAAAPGDGAAKPGEPGQRPGEPVGNGQPLVNGVATLKLPPADGIVIGIGFPPGSNYLASQSSPI